MTLSLFEMPWKGSMLRGILVQPEQASAHVCICVPGFEGSATTAKKYTALSTELGRHGVASLRVDFIGCGLSDGSYADMTVADLAMQMQAVCSRIRPMFPDISYVGHSLGACVIAKLLQIEPTITSPRLGFLSPALNQKELLRYLYMREKVKILGLKPIEWGTYRQDLNEQEFLRYCHTARETKYTIMQSGYFLENNEMDYRTLLPEDVQNILFVCGDRDQVVPTASFQSPDMRIVTVIGGDHENEKPSLIEQWLPAMVTHVCGKVG